MTQFGLSSTNSHWGYSAAGAYPPYFTSSALSSCGAPTTQFNTPALGFSGSTPDQSSTQDAFTASSTVSTCKYYNFYCEVKLKNMQVNLRYRYKLNGTERITGRAICLDISRNIHFTVHKNLQISFGLIGTAALYCTVINRFSFQKKIGPVTPKSLWKERP